ncbi:hypothetical protein ACFQ1M_00150 [Sungkyunkwania multivorans]|uniref:Uncharacterized protein n=1 Tax=Sungkyunkwania multivorans TaxID=1173618 RepID=A0ABW3CS44_9FLAO
METTKVLHKVQLVDGMFTPSEASDVINNLIDVKINFHKLHRLSMREGDEHCNTSYDDGRLSQLLAEKEEFKAVYREAKLSGKTVRINGIINVEISDH